MPLNVKNEDAHNLARELARLTNTTITDAVTMALADAVAHARKGGDAPRGRVERELHEIAPQAASLPLLCRYATVAAPIRSSATARTGCRANGHRHFGTHCYPRRRAGAGTLRGARSNRGNNHHSGDELLFKGADFAQTDVATVV